MESQFFLLLGCASQERICLDRSACCHTDTEVEDQSCYLTRSQYSDNGPTSPCTDLVTPSAWRGSRQSTYFRTRKVSKLASKSQ